MQFMYHRAVVARRSASLALLLSAGLASTAQSQVVDTRWLTATSGTWNSPARWSGGVSPYNNTPSGTTYRVTLDATGTNYTVTLAEQASLDLLTINSANATLALAAGSILECVNGVELRRGTLRLNGGTLRGTVQMLGGTIAAATTPFTTLDSVSLIGTASFGGAIAVRNGLNVTNMTFTGSGAVMQFRGSQSLTGGTLTLSSTASQISAEGATTLTIASGAGLAGSGIIGTQMSDTSGPNALVNTGLIEASVPAAVLSMRFNSIVNNATMTANRGILELSHARLTSVVNNGVIRTNPSGEIRINPSVLTNNGTIDMTGGGLLLLVGNYGIPSLGTILRGPALSQVGLGGTFNMAGGELQTNTAAGGAWTTYGSTVRDGTIRAVDAVPLRNSGNTTFNNVQFVNNVQLGDATSQGNITFTNNTTVTDTLTVNGLLGELRYAPTASFTGQVILAGGGTVRGDSTLTIPATSSLIIASVPGGRDASLAGTTFTNDGLIEARGSDSWVTMSATTTTNRGTLSLTDGANLSLATGLTSGAFVNQGVVRIRSDARYAARGAFTMPQLGVIDNVGGFVVIAGELDNRSSVFALSDGPAQWRVQNGTIRGGEIVATGASNFLLSTLSGRGGGNAFSQLIGVRMRGDFTATGGNGFASEISLRDSFDLDGTLNLAAATLRVYSTMSINRGTITASGTGTIICQSGNVLTFGPNAVVRLNTGKILTEANSATLPERVVFRGSMTVEGGSSSNASFLLSPNLVTSGAFTIAPGSALTIGGESARVGGTFTLGQGSVLKYDATFGAALDAQATFNNTGGIVFLEGRFNNAGQTLVLTPGMGSFRLNGLLSGGNIGSVGGAAFGLSRTISSDSAISGVLAAITLTSDIEQVNTNIGFADACNFGSHTFTLRGTTLVSAPLGGNYFSTTTLSNGRLLLIADATNSVTAALSNSGSLTIAPDFEVAGGSRSGTARLGFIGATATPTTITNQGLIHASTADHTLSIAANTVNNRGRMFAENGGILSIFAGASTRFDNTGGVVEAATGGRVNLSGNINTSALGTLITRDGGSISIGAALQNTGTTLNITPTMGNVTFLGQIIGGSINAPTPLRPVRSVLSNVTSITGQVQVADGITTVIGSFPLNGTTRLLAGGGLTFSTARQYLSQGTYLFEGTAADPGYLSTSGLNATDIITIPAGVFIRGGGGGLQMLTAPLMRSAASITADRAAARLELRVAAFENQNLLAAENGGQILVRVPGVNPARTADLRNIANISIELGSTIAVDDDFIQTSSGSLRLILTASDASPPALLTADSLVLDGLLTLELGTGAIPRQGTTFTIWNTRELAGQFSRIASVGLPADYSWDTSRLYSNGTVKLIPAPGSIATALAVGLFAGRRRRR
ncbi:MAG: hypothetical protein NTV94_19385 [Planctomycetota bacterium]|nr:hypothetical protein [Planctomycetota bacterium]